MRQFKHLFTNYGPDGYARYALIEGDTLVGTFTNRGPLGGGEVSQRWLDGESFQDIYESSPYQFNHATEDTLAWLNGGEYPRLPHVTRVAEFR